MTLEREVAIVIPLYNQPKFFEAGLHQQILELSPPNTTVFLVTNRKSTPEFIDMVQRRSVGQTKNIYLENGPDDLASAYLIGLSRASTQSDIVLQMDGNLAHKPEQISQLVEPIRNGSAEFAWSTRVSLGGQYRYPLHREIVSRGGTAAAWIMFGLNPFKYPDLTSGFESSSSRHLQRLFNKYPIDKWISVVRGPGHFIQTESRLKSLTFGDSPVWIPIDHGKDRSAPAQKLPPKIVAKALVALMCLKDELAGEKLVKYEHDTGV